MKKNIQLEKSFLKKTKFFKNLKSCQTAGEKTQKQFTQDIDITNGVAYNKCSYICIDQGK